MRIRRVGRGKWQVTNRDGLDVIVDAASSVEARRLAMSGQGVDASGGVAKTSVEPHEEEPLEVEGMSASAD